MLVLMSIKPRFAEAILSGRKHCEFRRSPFSKPVSHIIIYATAPIQKVVGVVVVDGVEHDELRIIKDKYVTLGDINEREFDQYFNGKTNGTAILLGTRIRFTSPVDINALWTDVHPPQSYCYLEQSKMPTILNLLALQGEFIQSH
jgi:predicted transcriptional regulator